MNRREPREADLSQAVFELQLIQVEGTKAVLITPEGLRVTVTPPPGNAKQGGLPEFQSKFMIKDLGIQARLLMGLSGYTRTCQTTRIVHQGEYLPMHLPVIAICPRAAQYRDANQYCTFCWQDLRNRKGESGAFRECWFCLDSPSWHHGACCPHNPMAREWNGLPHRSVHQANMQRFIRTLPF